MVHILRVADVVHLIASDMNESEELRTRLETTVNKFGMEINTVRSKILVNSRQTTQPCSTNINHSTFQIVDQFKYLGSGVAAESYSSKELRTK